MNRWVIEWHVFIAYTVMCISILFSYVWWTPYEKLHFLLVAFYYICSMVGIFYLTFIHKQLTKQK